VSLGLGEGFGVARAPSPDYPKAIHGLGSLRAACASPSGLR